MPDDAIEFMAALELANAADMGLRIEQKHFVDLLCFEYNGRNLQLIHKL